MFVCLFDWSDFWATNTNNHNNNNHNDNHNQKHNDDNKNNNTTTTTNNNHNNKKNDDNKNKNINKSPHASEKRRHASWPGRVSQLPRLTLRGRREGGELSGPSREPSCAMHLILTRAFYRAAPCCPTRGW
jgi:hypothetical protein